LWIDSVAGPAIYCLRILMATSMAGVFGASMTHVSRLAPPVRMAEMIGTLGTSGFIGMLVGPLLADWVCRVPPEGHIRKGQLDALFLFAAALCSVGFVCAWASTRDAEHKPPRWRAPLAAILLRYSPGPLLLVAVAVGAGVNLPGTFLRTYAAELGIESIGLFFAVYAVTAFATRLATRRFPERFGGRAVIAVGLAALVASILMYLAVFDWRFLVLPGAAGGAAHALLFPAVVGGVGMAFPTRYRGLATTLALAFFDAGTLLGAPSIGASLRLSRLQGWPAYPTTFCLVAGALTVVGGVFLAGSFRRGK
jgi:MFS family permease